MSLYYEEFFTHELLYFELVQAFFLKFFIQKYAEILLSADIT